MNQSVKQKIAEYPADAKAKIEELRAIIYNIASEQNLGEVTESLKWGEPSYSVAGGSPIRIDWKPRAPHSVSLYFNCKTKLVETFREIYKDSFQFIGNRELRLKNEGALRSAELSHCIQLALTYHKVKSLPLLGC
ncbi:MAG: DUF1801 domain-containing protein [Kangiellaceae bacterium]|jgi:Domain of unknown function (DU1801)